MQIDLHFLIQRLYREQVMVKTLLCHQQNIFTVKGGVCGASLNNVQHKRACYNQDSAADMSAGGTEVSNLLQQQIR